MKLRVLVTGGGTGGHIYPIVAVVTELQIFAAQRGINLEIRYLGAPGPYRQLLWENGLKVQTIPSSKLRRYFAWQNLIDFPKFIVGLLAALWKIYWFMPDVLLSKGGPGALPVVLAAYFYRIPIIIHESDSVPGLTNAFSAKFAKIVTVAFPSTAAYFKDQKKEVVVVGNPIRRYLFEEEMAPAKAKRFFGFSDRLPLILFWGGSQGSVRINQFVLRVLPALLQFSQVFHQTGKTNYDSFVSEVVTVLADLPAEIQNRYKAIDYFEKDLRLVLQAADLVVSRAGAGAIFEIAAFGRPAILIPLPESAGNHQSLNAALYSQTGAAIVIEESNLLPNLFVNQVQNLLTQPEKLLAMNRAALNFSKPEAALKLAQLILTIKGDGFLD
jgi:UDP-N-acetylglucosamine--N-acetylmuramyl-(pentapeptide) pyrophosphoryl-undecaprenol N-acetylglucosamine transferase